MKTLWRLVINLVSVMLGGFAIVLASFEPVVGPFTEALADYLTTGPGRVVFASVGAMLILAPLALLVRFLASRRYAREISYQTEIGTVSVSLIAIEEALTRAVEHENGVRKVVLRVYEDRVKRLLVIEAALTLWDDGDVTTINRRCQDLIRNRLAELMPEQTAVQIHLSVHRLNQRRSTETTAEEPSPAPVAPVPVIADKVVRGDVEVDDRPPLPGLIATHGDTDNQAGAALLARRRHEDGTPMAEGRVTGTEPPASARHPGEHDADADEDDAVGDYADLYLGPTYPVADDDEEESSSS